MNPRPHSAVHPARPRFAVHSASVRTTVRTLATTPKQCVVHRRPLAVHNGLHSAEVARGTSLTLHLPAGGVLCARDGWKVRVGLCATGRSGFSKASVQPFFRATQLHHCYAARTAIVQRVVAEKKRSTLATTCRKVCQGAVSSAGTSSRSRTVALLEADTLLLLWLLESKCAAFLSSNAAPPLLCGTHSDSVASSRRKETQHSCYHLPRCVLL